MKPKFPTVHRRPHTRALVALITSVVAACGSAAPGESIASIPDGASRVQVVASTNVYGSVVSAVGGDLVEVDSLIENANADPLEYEATAADAAAVNDADLVVYNGNGYDDFMPRLLEASDTKATVVNVVELSGLKASGGDGEFNEHVFYDMATIERLADRIAEALGSARPAEAATFRANADAFKVEITKLRTRLGAIAADHAGARVAVTEPLPGYLTAEAGLVNVTPDEFAEAIEEGDDPSAAALADMLALFGADPVDVLILNTQTQSRATDQVRDAAGKAGVPVVSMSETLTSPDYVTWMSGQIEALAGALNAK